MVLRIHESFGYGGKAGKVVRGQRLSFDDGEADLDLVKSARTHRQMSQDEVGKLALQAPAASFSAMRKTVMAQPGPKRRRSQREMPHSIAHFSWRVLVDVSSTKNGPGKRRPPTSATASA